MADQTPTRLLVMQRLTEVLEEVEVQGPYAASLVGSVFRGRGYFGESDPIPMISILEAIEGAEKIPEPVDSPKRKSVWPLLIQGFVEDDFDNPLDPAYYLLAAVEKRLVEERTRSKGMDILGLGNVVTRMSISPGVARPADEVSGKAYFWIRLDLTMVECVEAPYHLS